METLTTRRIAVAVLCALMLVATPEWAVGSPSRRIPRSTKPIRFTATAYCKGTVTAAGTTPRKGVVAADPDLLPIGATIAVRDLNGGDERVYTVMDTGSKVQGRHIDVYHANCYEAKQFGRRSVQVRVLSSTY